MKYSVNSKANQNLLSSSSHQDGTLDSRNDFQGEWTRPTNSMNQVFRLILINKLNFTSVQSEIINLVHF